ncbi:hypothetical protein [Azospirillum halopraeferens]|uniref:hypothetical protein n=1 Tax=Azospirillum halopraeferens TaxID=34010 RepID=UPI00041627A8|nr:hypothetical protein [Azospirillum halopraeferens]
MRLLLLFAALAFAAPLAVPPVVVAADLPGEAEVRAVLPIWCKYENEERVKLQKEADRLFGIKPAPPAGQPLTMEMLSEHHKAVERWKEPRLKILNDAFEKATGLDFHAASYVAIANGMALKCR